MVTAMPLPPSRLSASTTQSLDSTHRWTKLEAAPLASVQATALPLSLEETSALPWDKPQLGFQGPHSYHQW